MVHTYYRQMIEFSLIIFINIKYMKQFIFVLLVIVITSTITAQGITKNGQLTNSVSTYVNKNGAIGIIGVNKNGGIVRAINNGSANALDLDGGNNYVTVPPAVYFSGDFTIECWVYPKSFGNWSRIIDFGNGAGSNNVLLAYSYGTSGAPGLYVEGTQFAASQTLVLNQWSHIAATLKGNTATIYINGISAGSATFPSPVNITRNNCYIGKSNWNGDPNANAIFDELRIWNTAKSQLDIQSSMSTELEGNEAGLVAYYNFNQGVADGVNTTITSLTDKTVNGRHGILHNFTLAGASSNWVNGAPLLLYDGSSALAASSSAYAIKQNYPSSVDGVYWINLPNVGPTQIYCIMDSAYNGGGWMLAMKSTIGTTFNYDATYWTEANTLNSTDNSRNDGDAKYETMNNYEAKDLMAIWPDILNNGAESGSIDGLSNWTWLQSNFHNEGLRTTLISKFLGAQTEYYSAFDGSMVFSGYGESIFSNQEGFTFYGINYMFNSGSKVRWGFAWNNETDQGSNDVSGGIGMDSSYGSYSAGDIINCCQINSGVNRASRVEVYIR